MTEETVGLSFQEAFEEAQKEETEVAASTPATPASEAPEVIEASDGEQPAVETEAEAGLFTGLAPEKAEDEQPEGDSYEVTVNGETSQVSRQELIDGYQRQADYTRGTQEIAAQKKANRDAQTLWEALEADYAGTVQNLMRRSGQTGTVQAAPETAPDIEAIVEAKLAEKLEANPRLVELENRALRAELDVAFDEAAEVNNLEPFSSADKQVILENANAMGSADIGYVVYRLLQQKAAQDGATKNAELTSTSKSNRSGSDQDTDIEPVVYNTVAEAWAASLAEEGNL